VVVVIKHAKKPLRLAGKGKPKPKTQAKGKGKQKAPAAAAASKKKTPSPRKPSARLQAKATPSSSEEDESESSSGSDDGSRRRRPAPPPPTVRQTRARTRGKKSTRLAGKARVSYGKGGELLREQLQRAASPSPAAPQPKSKKRKRTRARPAGGGEVQEQHPLAVLKARAKKLVAALRHEQFKLRSLTERWRGTESVELDEVGRVWVCVWVVGVVGKRLYPWLGLGLAGRSTD
jgi:hypothetical protein